jgi:hypothetical protein
MRAFLECQLPVPSIYVHSEPPPEQCSLPASYAVGGYHSHTHTHIPTAEGAKGAISFKYCVPSIYSRPIHCYTSRPFDFIDVRMAGTMLYSKVNPQSVMFERMVKTKLC